jgi:hypothetical protein
MECGLPSKLQKWYLVQPTIYGLGYWQCGQYRVRYARRQHVATSVLHLALRRCNVNQIWNQQQPSASLPGAETPTGLLSWHAAAWESMLAQLGGETRDVCDGVAGLAVDRVIAAARLSAANANQWCEVAVRQSLMDGKQPGLIGLVSGAICTTTNVLKVRLPPTLTRNVVLTNM